MIYASVFLLVVIRNLLVQLAEKILLMQPRIFGGDYRPIALVWKLLALTLNAFCIGGHLRREHRDWLTELFD